MLLIVFSSCQKNDTTSNEESALNSTKTASIKIGEPVVFSMSQTTEASNVLWSVNPATNTQINTNGSKASILFGSKGNYVVTAATGNIKTTSSVNVTDSSFIGNNSNPNKVIPFSTGETIEIKASRIDSISLSTIILSISTTNKYTCLSNFLALNKTYGTNSYEIELLGVSVPTGCTDGTSKAGAFLNLGSIKNSSSTLTVKLNGKTYTGTIVKTGNSYTINWPYTSGVFITPSSL